MPHFEPDYKIKDIGGDLCVVFNLKTEFPGMAVLPCEDTVFNEDSLKARIRDNKTCGHKTELEERALRDLQSRKQVKPK